MRDSKKYSESELWLSFISGDKEAFSIFYKKMYEQLYSYGLNLGTSTDQIRDIIQELFIKIYTKPEQIKEVSTIRSFLFVSVRNAFINQEKYKSRHVRLSDIESFSFSYSIENTKIEDEEELKSIKDRVDRIISMLTPRQKEIIYLRFLHQMEYEEIAKVMDMSEQAARNLIYRAMEKVRKNDKDFIVFLLFLSLLSNK